MKEPRRFYTTADFKKFTLAQWSHAIMDEAGCSQLVGLMRALRAADLKVVEAQEARSKLLKETSISGYDREALLRANWMQAQSLKDLDAKQKALGVMPHDPCRDSRRNRSVLTRDQQRELSEVYLGIFQEFERNEGIL